MDSPPNPRIVVGAGPIARPCDWCAAEIPADTPYVVVDPPAHSRMHTSLIAVQWHLRCAAVFHRALGRALANAGAGDDDA
jgi:hypothetical protein